MAKPSEHKSARFRRLAANRTNAAIKAIRLLGNLSNKHNYTYTESEFKHIFNTIEGEMKIARSKFLIALSKGKKFSL